MDRGRHSSNLSAASLVSDGGTKCKEVMVNGGGLSVFWAPLVCSVLTAEGEAGRQMLHCGKGVVTELFFKYGWWPGMVKLCTAVYGVW